MINVSFFALILLLKSLIKLILVGGGETRQRRGSVGSLDSGMSISMSFQSTPTNNNNNNASRIAENSTPTYVTTSQVAVAVSSVTQRPSLQTQPINANGHIVIPPLLPNSALYQYNNEQMIHMHELYEDHHHNNHHQQRSQPEATGRSTDV